MKTQSKNWEAKSMVNKSIRDAYGEALKTFGAENKDIVVLDADVSGSTKSGIFGKAYPERYFNVGIAEQNMMAMAAGLSTTGKFPLSTLRRLCYPALRRPHPKPHFLHQAERQNRRRVRRHVGFLRRRDPPRPLRHRLSAHHAQHDRDLRLRRL
jgi:hypothetical protein